MTEERLKEIKDSIDLQLEVAKHIDVHNVLALEEKELYDYAELLKERISYLEKSIVRKEETITELEQESVPYTNEYVDKVEKENEELKKQLNELQKLQIFIDTQDIEERYGEGKYQDYLEEQVKELKKQLEERPKEYVFIGNAQNKTRDFINKITKDNKEYKTQQQAFIKYLEDEINRITALDETKVSQCSIPIMRCMKNDYKQILQKYKEIIGE